MLKSQSIGLVESTVRNCVGKLEF